MMNQDTVGLLQQCNAGCKNATNSMEQVRPYTGDESLGRLIEQYDKKHIDIGDACHRLLREGGHDEKDPGAAAKAMSWLGTEVKLAMDDSARRIAELMTDGCHMGIKSVARYLNQYRGASEESRRLARRLIETEQEFMDDLLEYL